MKTPLRFVAFLAAALLVPAAVAVAADIEIHHPWARATAPSAANGAAFMVIYNTGADDRIVSAAADVSNTVELHTHVMDGDIMRMREVEAIEVPGGGPTELKPGGLHIMFMGLDQPLKEGESFPLTLRFENAGEITVDVAIDKPGAMGPHHGNGHHDMHGDGHHGMDHGDKGAAPQ